MRGNSRAFLKVPRDSCWKWVFGAQVNLNSLNSDLWNREGQSLDTKRAKVRSRTQPADRAESWDA